MGASLLSLCPGQLGFSFFPAGGPPTPSGGLIFWDGFGRYWGRALVKAILNRILRSIIWAWSQGRRFSRGSVRGGFLYFFGAVPGVQNWKRIFEKTRVGFGRTELSLRLSCTEFCALSSGHGPRNPLFRRFLKILDSHDFSKSLQTLKK